MKVRAKDTLNVSSVKSENILPGEWFVVSDDFARQLIERGLVTAEEQAAPAAKAKAAAPQNKMDKAPSNKSPRKRKGS